MLRTPAQGLLAALVLVASVGCGFDTSATFNSDGSVTVGFGFMVPKSLLDPGSGVNVTGLSPSDIASAQAKLQKQYPGAKVMRVTEGDETGAAASIPFKTEKEAFTFLTAPSKLSASSASSGSGLGLNLSDTGGFFKTATHTSSGGADTYSFTTSPPPTPSPSPGSQSLPGAEAALTSVFVLTFSITVPHVITSAPGALFTLDRKTAIWKVSWTSPQTLTATTGSDAGLVTSVSPSQDFRLMIAVGFIAVAVGFLLGMLLTWRGRLRPRAQPASMPMGAMPAATPQPPAAPLEPVAWPGPPPEAPPPTKL